MLKIDFNFNLEDRLPVLSWNAFNECTFDAYLCLDLDDGVITADSLSHGEVLDYGYSSFHNSVFFPLCNVLTGAEIHKIASEYMDKLTLIYKDYYENWKLSSESIYLINEIIENQTFNNESYYCNDIDEWLGSPPDDFPEKESDFDSFIERVSSVNYGNGVLIPCNSFLNKETMKNMVLEHWSYFKDTDSFNEVALKLLRKYCVEESK